MVNKMKSNRRERRERREEARWFGRRSPRKIALPLRVLCALCG